MLIADAVNFNVTIESAGIIATGIAGGLAGAMKLFTGYMKGQNKMLSDEIKAGRLERTAFQETIMTIHGEAMQAVHGVEKVLVVLNERICDETGLHVRIDTPDQAKISEAKRDARLRDEATAAAQGK